MATVFLLPSCCRFWFPMRETGGFLKGWPRFLLLWRSADDTVGGSVEAQSVIITAPPVLHGRPPWNTNECGLFFFYQLSLFLSLLVHSLDLHPSSSYSFLSAFFAFKSTCFRPSLCLFLLSPSLLTSACFPRCFCRCLSWGLSAGLNCAVICHTTEGKKHLLLMLPSCRSFLCLSVSGHLVFALFTSVIFAVTGDSSFYVSYNLFLAVCRRRFSSPPSVTAVWQLSLLLWWW